MLLIGKWETRKRVCTALDRSLSKESYKARSQALRHGMYKSSVSASGSGSASRYSEDFLIISFDRENRSNTFSIASLLPVINDMIKYTSSNDCYDSVSKVTHERICFIVCASLAEEMILRIHHCLQINSIYIFCAETEYHAHPVRVSRQVK